MTGQKRRNINALMQEFNLKSVIVRETELPAGKFVIIAIIFERRFKGDMHIKYAI